MKLLKTYINGNYSVSIFEDGTKIRKTNDDEFIAEFPENIDLKITNYCEKGCPMCHEKSNKDGLHSDILNEKFIKSLVPGTEVALGGGMVTKYPHLKQLLEKLKKRGIIANMTLHQEEFLENKEFVDEMIANKLVYGIGVSLHNCTDEFINVAKKYPNLVIHTIAGITKMEDFDKMANNDLKILILGYKNFGRGIDYFDKYQEIIKNNINELKKNLIYLFRVFKVVSFDNLALNQLETYLSIEPEEWEEFYMGDDGQHTMYIDAVERTFAKNSTRSIRYKLMDDIKDMFKIVKEE